MSSTAVIGVSFVDIKGFPFNPYIPTGTNAGNVKIVHGGVCRNVVENMANIGMDVSFVSLTDKTPIGTDVANHLSEVGVDLKYMALAESAGVGMWLVILDENGNLTGSISQMPILAPLEELIMEKGEEIVASCDNIVLEIDMNEAIADKILNLSKKYAKDVYVIVGNMETILKHIEYLKTVSCFICNEVEAGRLFKADLLTATPEEMLPFMVTGADELEIKRMVVTMGSQGCVYYDSLTGEQGRCFPHIANLVDSTGAGDAFLSGTVMGLSKGLKLKDAVEVGTKLAASTIEVLESTAPKDPSFFDEFEDLY